MQRIVFTSIFFLMLSSSSFSQKEISLKRKYFGKYKGTIAPYTYKEANKLIDVAETSIYIDLFKDDITIKIGSHEMKGIYTVMFEADQYYLVDAQMEGVLPTERIIVYKKGKHIGRDGLYPQPVTELDRYAKK